MKRVLLLGALMLVFTGVVNRVIDGDTLVVNGERVRLSGLDCAEMDTEKGRKITAAIQWLVGMEVGMVREGRDKYGRTLGTIIVNGGSLNTALIESGTCQKWN